MELAFLMEFSSLEQLEYIRVLLVHLDSEVQCHRLPQASFHPCLFGEALRQRGVYRGYYAREDDGGGDRLVSENNEGNEDRLRYKFLDRAL